MANTYTQVHIHFVFAVKFRLSVIQPEWEEQLHKYITAIVQNNKHKLLAINSVSDHLHMFVGLHTTQSIADLMEQVKGDSSEFINKRAFTTKKFNWQVGYGAFSHSHSQVDTVIKYILNQKEHHKKVSFKDEYVKMLKDYKVDYDEKYTFQDLMD